MKKAFLVLSLAIFLTPLVFASTSKVTRPQSLTYEKMYDLLSNRLDHDFDWAGSFITLATLFVTVFSVFFMFQYFSFKKKAEDEIEKVKTQAKEKIDELHKLSEKQKKDFEVQESELYKIIELSRKEFKEKIKAAEANLKLCVTIEGNLLKADSLMRSNANEEALTLLKNCTINASDKAQKYMAWMKIAHIYHMKAIGEKIPSIKKVNLLRAEEACIEAINLKAFKDESYLTKQIATIRSKLQELEKSSYSLIKHSSA